MAIVRIFLVTPMTILWLAAMVIHRGSMARPEVTRCVPVMVIARGYRAAAMAKSTILASMLATGRISLGK